MTYIGIIGNSTKTTHQTLKLGKCIYLLNKVVYFLNWMPAAHFSKMKQGCVYCCDTSSFSERLMTLSVGKHYSLNSDVFKPQLYFWRMSCKSFDFAFIYILHSFPLLWKHGYMWWFMNSWVIPGWRLTRFRSCCWKLPLLLLRHIWTGTCCRKMHPWNTNLITQSFLIRLWVIMRHYKSKFTEKLSCLYWNKGFNIISGL